VSYSIVTGYVRLDSRHRGHGDFIQLGQRLLDLGLPTVAFLDDDADSFSAPPTCRVVPADLERCTLYACSRDARSPAACSHKDTTDYMVVQHQKSAWLSRATDYTQAEILAWVDFGVLHVPGVNPEHIEQFAARLADAPRDKIVLPTIWNFRQDSRIRWHQPNWWFAGGVAIVPRGLAGWWADRVATYATRRIAASGQTTWEINTWAAIAQDWPEYFAFYKANHDPSLFVNFQP